MTSPKDQPEWMGWHKIRNVEPANSTELSQWVYYMNRMRKARAGRTVCSNPLCDRVLRTSAEIKWSVCREHFHTPTCQCGSCKRARSWP